MQTKNLQDKCVPLDFRLVDDRQIAHNCCFSRSLLQCDPDFTGKLYDIRSESLTWTENQPTNLTTTTYIT